MERSNAEIYQDLADYLSWAFEVRIAGEDKAEIERSLLAGWFNEDRSEQDFVDYLLQQYDTVRQVQGAKRDEIRPQALGIFRKLFTKAGANDRGRVLATIQQVVERLRPGASGVPLQLAAPTPGAVVTSGHALTPPTPPQGGYAPPTPAPIYAGAPSPPQGYGQPANVPQPYGYPQPVVAQYPPGYPQPGYGPPAHGGAPPGYGYPAPNGGIDPRLQAAHDAADTQRKLEREIQRIAGESAVNAAIHGATMTVIGNIK